MVQDIKEKAESTITFEVEVERPSLRLQDTVLRSLCESSLQRSRARPGGVAVAALPAPLPFSTNRPLVRHTLQSSRYGRSQSILSRFLVGADCEVQGIQPKVGLVVDVTPFPIGKVLASGRLCVCLFSRSHTMNCDVVGVRRPLHQVYGGRCRKLESSCTCPWICSGKEKRREGYLSPIASCMRAGPFTSTCELKVRVVIVFGTTSFINRRSSVVNTYVRGQLSALRRSFLALFLCIRLSR